MAAHRKCWILVADGHRARIVSPDWDSYSWQTVDSWTSEQTHLAKLQGERPGRSFESASSARHGIGARQEPQKLDRHDFAHVVAQALAVGLRAGAYEELVLVAGKQFLGELRPHLNPEVDATVTVELDRDLTKLEDKALFAHLAALPGGLKWSRLVA